MELFFWLALLATFVALFSAFADFSDYVWHRLPTIVADNIDMVTGVGMLVAVASWAVWGVWAYLLPLGSP